jgi:hypothetical protein
MGETEDNTHGRDRTEQDMEEIKKENLAWERQKRIAHLIENRTAHGRYRR